MRVVSVAESLEDKANKYVIELDDGRTVTALHRWYAPGGIVVSAPDNVSVGEIVRFLYDSEYEDDFKVYGVRRQKRYAYAPVVDYCYSKHQALELAKITWDNRPESWYFFEVFRDKNVIIKDFVGRKANGAMY